VNGVIYDLNYIKTNHLSSLMENIINTIAVIKFAIHCLDYQKY